MYYKNSLYIILLVIILERLGSENIIPILLTPKECERFNLILVTERHEL